MAQNTGDGYIRIGADISQCMSFFDGLDVNKKAIQKNLLRTVGTGAKQATKKNLNHYLRRRSGTLYKSITSRLSRSGKSVVISNNAESGKNTAKDGRAARYGFMLAAGYTIEAKTSKGLTFNIDGQWFRCHSVTVHEKDFVEPSVDRYVNSADCGARIDKEFQKQVDYWERRITGGNSK